MADALLPADTETVHLANIHKTRAMRLAWAFALPAMMLALLAPAIWNGFPLIFSDTGGYLARPFEGTLEMGRSALFGAFLATGIPFDFWPQIVIQAALSVWIIVLTLRAYGLGGRPVLALALVAGLCALTGLPWYVGQLEPDILVPLAALALHLLTFRRRTFGMATRIGLVALVAVSIASHMAIMALCLALFVAFGCWYAVLPKMNLPRPALRLPAIAVAAGIALALLSNFAIAGQFAFTPGGVSFLFGRLVQDGIVARYLADDCPDRSIKLCAYQATLPNQADDWLWSWQTPFYDLGGPEGYAPEEQRIILRTLKLYPMEHLTSAIGAVIDQLALTTTDISTSRWDNEHTLKTFQRLVPDAMPRLRAARQQIEGALNVEPLNVVHVPLAYLAMILLPVMVFVGARRGNDPGGAALALTMIVTILANAAICGIFSNPVDRYEARLIWLAPFAVVICLIRWWRGRESAGTFGH